MRLTKGTNIPYHVSLDTINEFESTILSDKNIKIAIPVNPEVYKVAFFIFRVFRKIGVSTIFHTQKRFLENPLADEKHLFTLMMGLDELKYRPFAFTTFHCRSIFLFDAWEKDLQKIVSFVIAYRIDFIFVTASQSAFTLKSLLKKQKVYWIPEGINPNEYKYKQYNQKNIDILAVGRKNDKYHQKIYKTLKEKGIIYKYEKTKGEIIFPTREEFIEGLADTKISICFSSNITHPNRSGRIETMTIRYLQSIVSKCIILGSVPAEMIELFGYNPVIEFNEENPEEQLIDILNNFSDYIPLIEKNYHNVINNHTWQNRWSQIKQILHQNEKN